jgi:hypothetical protein
MFVQLYLDLDPNRSDLNEIIDKDAYMQQEYGRRNKLFIELQQTAHIDLLSVEALKALNGKAPLVALEYLPD